MKGTERKAVKCIFVTSTVECFIKKNVFLGNICAIKGISEKFMFSLIEKCVYESSRGKELGGKERVKLFMMVDLKRRRRKNSTQISENGITEELMNMNFK